MASDLLLTLENFITNRKNDCAKCYVLVTWQGKFIFGLETLVIKLYMGLLLKTNLYWFSISFISNEML